MAEGAGCLAAGAPSADSRAGQQPRGGVTAAAGTLPLNFSRVVVTVKPLALRQIARLNVPAKPK